MNPPRGQAPSTTAMPKRAREEAVAVEGEASTRPFEVGSEAVGGLVDAGSGGGGGTVVEEGGGGEEEHSAAAAPATQRPPALRAPAHGGKDGDCLSRMSVDEVCQWLVRIGCSSVVDAFRRHDIDGRVLVALDEAQLKSEVGVDSFGLRTKILLERASASPVDTSSQSESELILQLEPVEELGSRQRRRPAEIDVFSAPSPRPPSTPLNPGSGGSAGTTVAASPSQLAPSAVAGTTSADSAGSDVTTLADDRSTLNGDRTDSSAPHVSNPSSTGSVPRSPAFIMSPKLQGSLAPEQLNLRDRVQEGDAPGAQVLLEAAPAAAKKEWANTVDEQGFTLLMEAVALENLENSAETMRVLLNNGANASVADEDGYTALHWAAACDNEVAVSILVAEARVDVDCRCSARFGTETALHRGARMGNVDAVQALLEHGADLGARGAFNQTADEIAGDYDGRITLKHRAAIRKCLFTFQPRLRTLVLQHPDCLLHVTEDTHQEAPARIHAILRKLGQAKFFPPYEINVTDEFKAATDKAVGRAHTAEYLAFLRQLTAQVIAHPDRPAVPFTPKVQKLMQLQSDEEIKDADKSDTTFSAGSLQAALRAAGSVIAAIDAVVDGTHRNAFCCVRPPGHHAGANGLESDAVSCGFCIFNNVAIGALHALRERSSVVKKVAVIDFDVHHGNGTQAIFEGIDDPSAVFFFSIHLYDSDRDCPNCLPQSAAERTNSRGSSRQGGNSTAVAQRPPAASVPDLDDFEFYPGTGADDVMEMNVVNAPLIPLWKYGSGGRESRSVPQGNGRAAGNGRTGRSAAESTSDVKTSAVGGRKESVPRGRNAFRHAVRQRLLPSLRAFNPDLILLSAGFDGGGVDQGNVKLVDETRPNGLDLEESDFAWLTTSVLAVAKVCCEGRVVSVLEGGYGTQVHDSKTKKWTFNREVFASNVAAHVRALMGTSVAQD